MPRVNKGFSRLSRYIVPILILEGIEHDTYLVRRHIIRIPGQPLHRIHLIPNSSKLAANNLLSIGRMFIDKSLEERPKPVRLVYDSGESGIVAQEVLHFLDGALV